MTLNNARFWTWVNDGPVKLSLIPGQRLQHFSGHPTDEGFSTEDTSWELTLDGSLVTRDIHRASSDCDGRFDSSQTDECKRHFLDEFLPDAKYFDLHNGLLIKFPRWESVSAGQRDYAAEAMGY